MNDLFSQFADQFKPKEEPQKDISPEPIQDPIVVKEDRLVDRYEAYRKSHPEYISVKDFELLEQRENAVESLETMSEFEKKQRRLADKKNREALTGVVEEEPLPHVAIKSYIEEEFAKIRADKPSNLKPDEIVYALNNRTPYKSMPPGLKELQQLNGVNDHELHGKEVLVDLDTLEQITLDSKNIDPNKLLKALQEQGLMYYESQNKTKCYIGVDPGKKGGIVAITENGLVGKWTMPLLGDDIDAQGIWDILAELKSQYEITLVLEDVHSLFGMSAATNFSMGHTLGIILGIIVTSKIKLIRVAPKTWQKEIWNASDMEYKPMVEGKKKASIDTKLTSMKAAHRLFPNADFRATTRSKNDHDGITDSVCLAEYARRKNL